MLPGRSLKKQAIDVINTLPNKVSMDEIMEKLYFCTQVELGMEDFRKGRTLSLKQAEKKLSKWLSK